jgi:hypothetical protein
MPRVGRVVPAAAVLAAVAASGSAISAFPATAAHQAGFPRPDHVVIVMLENKRYDAVVGDPHTPWITSMAHRWANLTQFYAETHPSQPNYLALFSGSTQGVSDNNCPHELGDRINLGRQLVASGRTFIGYSEDLPAVGWRGCATKTYVRRHVPWTNFSNVPAASHRPYSAFPADYRRLPTVAFVIPNLCHDMHDCPKAQGDAWLKRQFAPYIAWATVHNSLFILTFDEDNRTGGNRIATIVAGARVRPGQYANRLDHYALLRTLQDMYGLAPTGLSAKRAALSGVWTVG